MPEPLDPTQWPKWLHHVTLESVLCATPDDEAALPEGYRATPYSDAEHAEHAREERQAATTAQEREVAALEEELTTPVAAPAKVKAPAKEPRWTPSGRTGRRRK